MPRIAHIAIKVEDLDTAAEFYEKVFALAPVGKSRSEDRSRNRLSDGQIDLTFLKYDDDKSAMAQAAGDGPCIHHFAIERDCRRPSLAVKSSPVNSGRSPREIVPKAVRSI